MTPVPRFDTCAINKNFRKHINVVSKAVFGCMMRQCDHSRLFERGVFQICVYCHGKPFQHLIKPHLLSAIAFQIGNITPSQNYILACQNCKERFPQSHS